VITRASGADTATLLAATPLFGDVEPTALRRIAQLTDEVHIAGGATLMNEGEPGESLYLVVSGRLQIFSVSQGPPGVVAEIGQHETVGEMAMLTGGPRSATVRAVRDSRLIRFSRAAFDRLVTEHPRAMMHVARMLVERFRHAVSMPRSGSAPATLAIAGAGPGAPVRQLAADLVRALAPFGPTLHLTASAVDSLLDAPAANAPTEGAGNVRLAAWLAEQEQRHRVVVYEADAGATEWTRRCLRQADRVVFVGRAASAPEPLGEAEAAFWRSGVTTKSALALVHEPTVDRPAGTEHWLQHRPVDSYHHLRGGVVSDVERLARHLLGRATSVVLSGGGARGFAHIGVLRALDEAGVPVDLVGGTSQGAIIGALYALGHDHRSMLDHVRRHFVDRGIQRLRDCTLPIVSLFNGRRAVQMMKAMFAETRIEDLWLSYFCVSSNLTRASCEVHRTGVLHECLRASAGIPGFFPPFPHNGDLLVDGGLLNNLPVDVARQLSAGIVIAVDVAAKHDLTTRVVGFDSMSGWHLLVDRLNPFCSTPRLPNITQILSRAATLGSIYHCESARRMADLYLRPPVERIGMLEWKALDDIAEVGYRYAAEQIAEWQRGGPQPARGPGSG
jgi:predicted acylesterase/phospholipase RssA